MPITVRYTPLAGGFCLVAGGLILFGGLVTGGPHLLVLGAVQVLLGVSFLTRPWYVVHADRIEVKNLFGMTLQTHRFASLAELDVQGGAVLHGEKRLRVGRAVARRDDWRAVVDAIQRARGEAPPAAS